MTLNFDVTLNFKPWG